MSEGWHLVDDLSRELSLAVEVTDGVVGGRPLGEPQVRVEAADERPFRNRSGSYLFFDLPAGVVTVAVDGGERYRDASTTVDLAADDFDRGEAVDLTLEPTPAYRFPPWLTRVRGTVLDGDAPVAGATVTVEDHDRTVTTTESGEYAYYFDAVGADDIERVDPQPADPTNAVTRYYQPGGDHPTFHVDGPPGAFDQTVEVEVGSLTTTDLTY